MPYSLWSRGRLLGETELGWRRWMPFFRAGDFTPTELGEKLMPIIVGVGPALKALYDVHASLRAHGVARGDDETHDYPEAVRRTSEYADAVSIADELESLALELRDPSGEVVETESLWINDTYRLLAIGREASLKEQPDFELDDVEPWETPPPRYQIMVALVGHDESMRNRVAPELDPEIEAELEAEADEASGGWRDRSFWDDLDEDVFNDESDDDPTE